MLPKISKLFTPIETKDLKHGFQAKFLRGLLILTFVVSILVAVIFLGFGSPELSYLSFMLAFSCGIGFYLELKNQHFLAKIIYSFSILFILTFLLNNGSGLRDPIVTAYPVFILITSILFGYRSVLMSTLFSIASVAQVFFLSNMRLIQFSDDPTSDQLIILSIIYGVAGLSIWIMLRHAHLTLTNLEDSYDKTLQGWALALEYRDGETKGHSTRVTNLCVELALAMGIADAQIPAIRRGALLHDIGKMAIPDDILQNKGELSDREWEIVKLHPSMAGEILAHIPFLADSTDIPRFHHEWWDGSGYPLGLSGKDIPLTARIFAIADVWDSLSSDRLYREAWPPEKILTYIYENSGKQFDPQLVEIFFSLVIQADKPPTTE